MTDLVSVCIPVFNGKDYISECIDSVLAQREVRFELIILDNCSTDSTSQVYNAYSDPRIKVKRCDRNIGSIANFNECIRNASGNFFLLLPHDDLLLPGALYKMLGPLKRDSSLGLCFGDTVLIDETGAGFGKFSQKFPNEVASFHPTDALSYIVENFNPLQHPLVRMDALKDGGVFFRKSMGSFADIDLWCRVIARGWGAYRLPDQVSALRVRPSQGQKLLQQSSAKSAETLSEHFAIDLTRNDLILFSQNLFFLRFIKSFNRLVLKFKIFEVNLVGKLLDRLISENLVSLLKSILLCRVIQFRREVLVTSSLVKWLGFKRIFFRYLAAIKILIIGRILQSYNVVRSGGL